MAEIDWSEAAWRHLCGADPVMARVAESCGPVAYEAAGAWAELVSAVVGQQLSNKAARSILDRLLALVGDPPDPEKLATTDPDTLRTAGLSRVKANSLHALGRSVVAGDIVVADLDEMEDAAVLETLCALPGIGPWTAGMVLVFGLGRPDVLLPADLGVRKGVQMAYRLDKLPSPKKVAELSKKHEWHPYATAANFYLWRVADGKAPV